VNSYKSWTREESYEAKKNRIELGTSNKLQHEAKTSEEVKLEQQILDAIFYLNKAKQSLYTIGLNTPDVNKAMDFMKLAKQKL
jgi:hypothetical protein